MAMHLRLTCIVVLHCHVVCPNCLRVFYHVFEQWLTTDDLQYGFKKHNSCSHALITCKKCVKYFVQKGSEVLCVSLDASKAFDKLLHHGLFCLSS